MPGPIEENGRVTLAVLSTKLDQLTGVVMKACDKLDTLSIQQAKWDHIPDDVEKLQEDVDGLKGRINIFSGANAALSILAGVLGIGVSR